MSNSGWWASGCGTPYSASTSGSSRASAPQSRSTDSIRAGCGSISPRASSCQTRSAASVVELARRDQRRISASVSGATTKPKRAAKRATRSTRSGSSANAGETWRSTPAARSRAPPWGSTSAPSAAARHRVDRQVAPREVVLERHLRRGEELEAAIAAGRACARCARARIPRASPDAGTPGNRGRPAGSPTPASSPASRRRRPSRGRRPGGRAARRGPSRRRGRSSRCAATRRGWRPSPRVYAGPRGVSATARIRRRRIGCAARRRQRPPCVRYPS